MDAITSKSHLNPLTTPVRSLHSAGGTERTTLDSHRAEVDKVASSVRSFHDRGEKFRIYHGSTNSTRKSALGRDPRKVVDTSRLNHVVAVDTEKQTALVEPNVPMDRLVEETLKYGLVPPVVMEFPGITVGGGYAGTSGESSSFKHGFFDRTLNWVEMVLANGEVVTASESENEDLFRGAAGAVGTLGVTTMVEIQLQKATKYVVSTYHPVTSMEHAIEKLREFTSMPDTFDYIDGILFTPTTGAIITGIKTDTPTPGTPIQRFSHARDPWFYQHVRSRISSTRASASPPSEAIPLPDYLFRYDRGGFWVGTEPFHYFSPLVPFNDFTRWALDEFLHTRMLYQALHASGRSEHMIIQDLALPFSTAAEFVKRMDKLTGIWPLWLCPLQLSPAPSMHPHLPAEHERGGGEEEAGTMLNIGLWGRAPPTHEGFIEANLAIERDLRELGGMKWLYAQTFAGEEEFWLDFDREWYDGLRAKYAAQGLPSVWEKVRVVDEGEREGRKGLLDVWPLTGFYGIMRAIESGDYLRARGAGWKGWVPRG